MIPCRRIESAVPIFASVAVSIIRTPFFRSVTASTSVRERRMSAGSIPSANLTRFGMQLPRSVAQHQQPPVGLEVGEELLEDRGSTAPRGVRR